MGARRRPTGRDGYNYQIVFWHQEHVPLRTNENGVKAVLSGSRLSESEQADFLTAINEGGLYTPPTGPVKELRRLMPDIEEQLRNVATTIVHDGKYGLCYWQRKRREVWWTYHTPDVNSPTATSHADITKMFMKLKEVKLVRLEREGLPDSDRDPGWVKVYPGRVW